LMAEITKEVASENLKYYFWNEEMGPFHIDNLKLQCFDVSIKSVER
ncbi:MAG: hypothetical protein HRT57_06665, partial [Crocinitomicaceae bacterium]|nr:hypothetical protein [Crocinitomicaceae bacterium]